MYKDNSISYQQVSVHFDRINIVNRFEVNRGSKRSFNKDDVSNDIVEPLVSKRVKFMVNNQMSTATMNKMSKAIRYLNFVTESRKVEAHDRSFTINFKIAFITLTLSSPQIHTDNEIKSKLLNQLFIELKRKYKVSHYVWRSEKQSTGNVHFHLLLDQFIPHQELRELWNRLQNKLGYVDAYAARMSKLTYKEYFDLFKHNKKYTPESIKKAWIKGKSTEWRYPNSTDVHSLLYINDIDKYLCKYMVKSEQNAGLEGRLWGCSQSLSNITGGVSIVDSSISSELSLLASSGNCRFFKGDYYQICFTDIMWLKHIGCNVLFNLYRDFLINHFKIESS
jgi:hypothetical protein